MKKGLVFRTQQKQKAKKTRTFFLGFFLFFTLFAGIVAVWFTKYIDHDLSNLFHRQEDQTTDPMTQAAQKYDDVSYFLFSCAGGENGEKALRFVVVAKVDVAQRIVSISALSDREVVDVGGVTASLAEHFRTGGISRLRAAVQTRMDMTVTAYVCSDDEGFDDAINRVGTLTLDIPEQISYRSDDFNFICAKGKKIFRGADLLKYLRYCGTMGQEGLKTQETIFAEMFRQYLTPSRVARADEYFSRIIDHVESDVTVMVFSGYKEALELLTAGDGFTVWTSD